MKRLVILLATAAIPFTAHAAKPKPPVMKQAAFVEEYMQCGKLRSAVKTNKDATLGCNAKLNLAACDKLDSLPREIQDKLGLELQCEFLGGELTGDAQKDKDIDALSNEIGCPLSSLGTVNLVKKNWGNEKVVKALLFFTDEYVEGESKCLKEDDGKKEEAAEPAKDSAKTEEEKKATAKKKPAHDERAKETTKTDEVKKEEPKKEESKKDEAKKEESKKETTDKKPDDTSGK